MTEKIVIRFLRVAYWLGIVLDALAFTQMAFPELGRKMLQVAEPLSNQYLFAISLGAGLMLAWTLLLFWADRKPLERRTVLPLTMIIIGWNIGTMVFGVGIGLIPAATLLPQIISACLLFVYYGACFLMTLRVGR
jgi:hypothetical protein